MLALSTSQIAMDTLLVNSDPVACVVVAVLVDIMRSHRRWGWMRLVAGSSAYSAVPGLLGAKVMGSGHGGGFTLRPSASHQGLICRFESADAAIDFLHGDQVQAFRERSQECWAGLMTVSSARGHWDQQAWGLSDAQCMQLSDDRLQQLPPAQPAMPLAVLTRASIHPAKATAFWRHAPAAQESLSGAQGCLLAMGLGGNLVLLYYVISTDPSSLLWCAGLVALGAMLYVIEYFFGTKKRAAAGDHRALEGQLAVDLGPGAGDLGGHVIFQGTPAHLAAARAAGRVLMVHENFRFQPPLRTCSPARHSARRSRTRSAVRTGTSRRSARTCAGCRWSRWRAGAPKCARRWTAPASS